MTDPHQHTPVGDRDDRAATWMPRAGVTTFGCVIVLLAFVLPPLFDTGTDGSEPGGHTPPAITDSSVDTTQVSSTPPTTDQTSGGHTPPAGGHGPPATTNG